MTKLFCIWLVFVLVFATGCAAKWDSAGVAFVAGKAQVGNDCKLVDHDSDPETPMVTSCESQVEADVGPDILGQLQAFGVFLWNAAATLTPGPKPLPTDGSP